MTRRHPILPGRLMRAAIAVAALTLAGPSLAQTPQPQPFDCPATIEGMISAATAEGLEWQRPGNTPHLLARDESLQLVPLGGSRRDFVSMDETVAGVFIGGWESHETGRYVGCALLAAAFLTQDEETGQRVRRVITFGSDRGPRARGPDAMPVLLLREFESESAHEEAFENWSTARYSVEMLAPEGFEQSNWFSDVYERGAAIPLRHELIARVDYLGAVFDGQRRSGEDNVRYQILEDAFVRSLMEKFGDGASGLANGAMIVCAPVGCDELLRRNPFNERALGGSDAFPSFTEEEELQEFPSSSVNGGVLGYERDPSGQGSSEGTIFATPLPGTDPAPADPGGSHAGDLRGDVGAAGDGQVAAPPQPLLTELPQAVTIPLFAVQLSLRTSRGDLTPLSPANVPLACILHHMGAQIDLRGLLDCDRPGYSDLAPPPPPASELVLIEPDNWVLQEHAQRAQILRVVIPATLGGYNCVMDAVFGAVSVPLDPVPGTPVFEGDIPSDVTVAADGTFELRVEVADPAGCGAPSRTIRLDARQEVHEVLLAEEAPNLEMLAHVFMLSRADLRESFGLNDADANDLGDNLLAAVGAAHGQLAQSRDGGLVPFSDAIVGAPDSQSNFLGSTVGRARLAEPNVAEIIYETGRDAARSQSATRSFATLSNLLRGLVAEAVANGSSRLRVTIIGPVHTTTSDRFNSVCDAGAFVDALSTVAPSVPVDVVVYPLFPLGAAQFEATATDIRTLSPLEMPVGTEAFPSGLTLCRGTPPGFEIYPYFFETWRSPRELPVRFAAALSDHLAESLFDLARRLEDFR